ncbi:MAG: ATP-binding protein [Flavobacteriales bacterium]|nr:ATP-binding protein [Flavobacteriales bacterium]
MRGFNPWWATGKAPHVPTYRRTAFAATRSYLTHPTLSRRAVLISGPRQTGKTTVLKQLVDTHLAGQGAPLDIMYLSMEHPILKLAGFDAILRAYETEVNPGDGPVQLLIDEIQHLKDWATYIKLTVDHATHRFRIVATGSAALEQKGRLAESGVGRWVTVPMPPLSFFEFFRIQGAEEPQLAELPKPSELVKWSGQKLTTLSAAFKGTMPLFRSYLLKGGFPETAKLADKDMELGQRLLREDVVERVLKRDMTALYGIRKVDELDRLFIYLCIHSGGILSIKSVADALGSNTTTVGNHLAALEQAHLVYKVQPIRMGGKNVLRAQHKYYLADAALRNAVLLKGREVLDDATEMGLLVETAVLRHLKAFHYRELPIVGYWRDAATEKEVDLVIKGPGYHLASEIKYRGDGHVPRNAGIVRYCGEEKVDIAFWVTKRDDDIGTQRIEGIDTPFLRIPAHVFCYLLGAAEQQHWIQP